MAQTVTRRRDRRDRREALRPYLVVLLEHDRPHAGSLRHPLEDIEVLRLGRGPTRRVEHLERGVWRLEVPDERISTDHAELRRELGRFVITDLRSKNGTLVGGRRLERALLSDGDRFELGNTTFVFRATLLDEPVTALDAGGDGPAGLVTLSPRFERELSRLRLVAQSRTPVLITGESGTGKELIARAVHAASGRSGPLVSVNCGALPPHLVESELFGYRRGAFSGATEDRPGLVRSADGGTLFLDEIGDLPPSAQVALLRTLQEDEVLPIGGVRPVRVDLRVVAATHRDLGWLVDQEQFRNDLLARLNGFSIHLPPLRERPDDLGVCVATLLRRLAPRSFDRIGLDGEVAEALLSYAWPQNVRELEQCLSAAVALSGDGEIELQHLPPSLRSGPPAPAVATTGDPLREALIASLREHHGNVSAVARTQGKARMQIQRWLKRYQLDARTFRR
jgi:transcriptional regulator with GAF, ATPase, and Fis domain